MDTNEGRNYCGSITIRPGACAWPAEPEASERVWVHEQMCKQQGAMRNPQGCLGASKGDRVMVSSVVFLLEFKGVML